MIQISVPDALAPVMERFIQKITDKGLDTLTWGEYLDKGNEYVKREKKSLALRPYQDNSEVAITDRLRVVLQLSGEAFLSPAGLEVSDRVLNWCLHAFSKQEGISTEESKEILSNYDRKDGFWAFMQLLDDPALNALVQILEKEWKTQLAADGKPQKQALSA